MSKLIENIAKALAPSMAVRGRTNSVCDIFWGNKDWSKTVKVHVKYENNTCYFTNICGTYVPPEVVQQMKDALTKSGVASVFKRN